MQQDSDWSVTHKCDRSSASGDAGHTGHKQLAPSMAHPLREFRRLVSADLSMTYSIYNLMSHALLRTMHNRPQLASSWSWASFTSMSQVSAQDYVCSHLPSFSFSSSSADKSETAIIVFMTSCFVLFTIAVCDLISVFAIALN